MQTRIVVLCDAWELLKFLNDDAFTLDEKAAAKELRLRRRGRCSTRRSPRSTAVDTWATADIEKALKAA